MAESNNKSKHVKRKENVKDEVEDDEKICGVGKDVLDFFKELNWDVVDSQQLKDCSRCFLPQKEEYPYKSHALKLIESELVPFSNIAIKLPPLPQGEYVEKVFYIPGVDNNSHIIYPQFSALTRKEQIQLFSFYYKGNGKPGIQDKGDLQYLIQKASYEYQAFQDFVQQQWISHQCGRILQVSSEVQRYLNNLWQTRASQCLALYPTQYRQHTTIPLALNDPNQDHTLMKFSKVFLKQGGMLWKMRLPYTRKQCNLISQYDQLCRVKPVSSPGQPDAVQPLSTPALPVSIDPMVDLCLQKENFDVVMTCSAIKAIVDCNTHKDWILPVTVKCVLNVFGNSSKKVVIIDKKLPASTMSVHDKNVWHAKIASKWALILCDQPHLLDHEPVEKPSTCSNSQPRQQEPRQTPGPPPSQQINTRTQNNVERESSQNEESSIEEFGVEESSPSQQQESISSHRDLTQYDDLWAEDSAEAAAEFGVNQTLFSPQQHGKTSMKSSTGLRVKKKPTQDKKSECLTKDFQSFSIDPGQASPISKKPVTRSSVNSAVSEKKDKKLPSETNRSSPAERRLECKRVHTDNVTPISKTNEIWKGVDSPRRKQVARRRLMSSNSPLMYKLWQLGKTRHYNMAKNEQRTLNILVRNREDGRYGKDEVYVSSRLEFQPEFGASLLDKTLLIREYVDLYLRQFSNLIRVRTVGHTGEVMLTELKNIMDLKEMLQMEGVELHKLFDPLYAVLTRLIDLPPGVYMLQHSARQGPFINLLQHSEDGGWSLASELRECRQVSANVPARKMDPHILTGVHHRDKLPPSVFPLPTVQSANVRYLKKLPPAPKKRKRAARKRKR